MEALTGMVLGLCFSIAIIKAYTIGISHGRQLAEGKTPKIRLNPVRVVTEAIEQHEAKTEEKKAEEELSDILNCSKESMLTAIKKENSR